MTETASARTRLMAYWMVSQMGVLNSAIYWRPVRLISGLVVLLVVLLTTAEMRAGKNDARRDSLYREALAQVGKVHPEASIEAFEQVLKFNWKFAPAHYEIAKLYMEMNTPLTRQSARKALDEAMRFDPENKDYHLTLGELLSRQGFWWHAVRQYEKLIVAEPDNAEAAYWAGYFAVQEYLSYIDDDSWNHLAERDLDRAKSHFRTGIDADPGFRGTYNLPERNRISEEIADTPRKQDGAETTVTAQYRGNQKNDFTFLQIDAANAPDGFHKLIVTLKDLYTGQIAERDVVFRVVE